MRPPVLLIFMTFYDECAHMLRGIAQYTRTHQQWAAFLDDEGRAEHDLNWLLSKKWRGVISRHTTPALVRNCRRLGIPLVDLHDVPKFPGVPKIRPDNVGIGHLGAEHFLERGFRHFGFCGFGNDQWSQERRDGFIESLNLAGHRGEVLDVAFPGNVTPAWDEEQTVIIAQWLEKLPKPVGVMACHDLRALEVIEAACSHGVMVPEEVAVLGANNERVRCDLSLPALSSVETNPYESGFQAAELLDRMIGGEDVGSVDLRIEPVGVVARPSTDFLAIDDRNVATALSFIRARACDGIHVDEVVRHASSSRSQLEKQFRRYIGRSPQAEIRRVQIGRVKQLLAETDFPLKRIAELVGFEHVEYLSVVFKRLEGDTPGHFRKRVRGTTADHSR